MWRGTFLYSPNTDGERGRLWFLEQSFDTSDFPDEEHWVHLRPVMYLDNRHERARRGGPVFDLDLGEPVPFSPVGVWDVDSWVTEVPQAELDAQRSSGSAAAWAKHTAASVKAPKFRRFRFDWGQAAESITEVGGLLHPEEPWVLLGDTGSEPSDTDLTEPELDDSSSEGEADEFTPPHAFSSPWGDQLEGLVAAMRSVACDSGLQGSASGVAPTAQVSDSGRLERFGSPAQWSNMSSYAPYAPRLHPTSLLTCHHLLPLEGLSRLRRRARLRAGRRRVPRRSFTQAWRVEDVERRCLGEA